MAHWKMVCQGAPPLYISFESYDTQHAKANSLYGKRIGVEIFLTSFSAFQRYSN